MLPSNFNYIDSLVERYLDDLEKSTNLVELVDGFSKEIKDLVFEARYKHHRGLEVIKNDLKSRYWLEVYRRSNLGDVLSSIARSKIEKSFYEDKGNLPEFTHENIQSTVQAWATDSYHMFSEKIDHLFNRLSGEHVTNSPSGFTKKMIYKHMISYYGFNIPRTFSAYSFNDYAVGLVHDLRTSIQMLFNLPVHPYHDTHEMLKTINERNEYTSFDNDAFKIKIFKNGNAHIEIHPHVAILLNCELSKLYPTAIPPVHRTVTKEIKEYKFEYDHLSSVEKNLLREFILYSKYYPINGKYVYKFQQLRYMPNDYVKGILKFLQVEEVNVGEKYTDYEYVSEIELHEPLRHIITNGIVEYKSNQYYPTPKNIVDDIVDYVGDTNGKSMLEPSAGMGNIAKRFKDANITCVEKEPLNCVILKEHKLNVVHGDFLEYNKGKYDIVVMNPPYNNKQWKTHTEHAYNLTNKGGEIYAVLPTGKLDDLSTIGEAELLNTYNNEFDNTAISTSLYRIKKS